jgi:hypothetical protein
MEDELRRYLQMFTAKASAAGLPVKKPGKNWYPLAPLAKGSHVSLSVALSQIQVNLNNDEDANRDRFDRLHAHRDEIEREVGEGLTWEKKGGRKKTAIRATMDAGYGEPEANWNAQHEWAVQMMASFERSFGGRLA